ncbi:hypothetical protein BJ166DRAFT_504587 [Pestalotiopsis sp. NC0098]|nr:hypothetical protein BJ166DRAFT_504587 [Pestalotiopsis sp. NC0098]
MTERIGPNTTAMPSDVLPEKERSNHETIVVESDPDETVDEGALRVVYPPVKKSKKLSGKRPRNKFEKNLEKSEEKLETQQDGLYGGIAEESALGHLAPLGPYAGNGYKPGDKIATIYGGITYKYHMEYTFRRKTLQRKLAARVRAHSEESKDPQARKKLSKQSYSFRVLKALRDVLSENYDPGRSEAMLLTSKHIPKRTITTIKKGKLPKVVRRTTTSELPILFDSWVPFQIDLVACTNDGFRIKFSDGGGKEHELEPEIPENAWPTLPSLYNDEVASDSDSEGTEYMGDRPAKRRKTGKDAGENVIIPPVIVPRVKSQSAWKPINVDDEGYVQMPTWIRQPSDDGSEARDRAVRRMRSRSPRPQTSSVSAPSSHARGERQSATYHQHDYPIGPLEPWARAIIDASLLRLEGHRIIPIHEPCTRE